MRENREELKSWKINILRKIDFFCIIFCNVSFKYIKKKCFLYRKNENI